MISLSATLYTSLLVVMAPAGPQQQTVKKPVAQAPVIQQPAIEGPAIKAPAAQAPIAATPELHSVETGILAHTNAQRARYGLRPLILDNRLLGSARRHAQWMSRNHTMQHTSAPVAENIAMGQNSPQEALNTWMNSSGHRANILNSGYNRIGVAAYRNSSGTTFWCQQFSR
jgi:uncharacterized protein YkwD